MRKHLLEDKLHFHASDGEGAWTTVHLVNDSDEERQFIGCVLADKHLIEDHLHELGWYNLNIEFKPRFIFDDEESPKYHRYGSQLSIKPLIIKRFYNNIFPSEIEISEEFRHYFNIYVNGYKDGTYCGVREDGEEIEIVKFEKNHVQIRTQYLKEYAAIKGLEVLVIFEYFRFFAETLEGLGVKENQIYRSTDEQLNFQIDFQVDNYSGKHKSNTRLLGKNG